MTAVDVCLRLFAGFTLGCLFYGGLWLTVRTLPKARHPAALAIGSLSLRLSLTAGGIAFLAGGRWWNVVAVLVGFESARLAILMRARCT
jgi:F1F0 ATPase subunit 2